MDLLQTRGGAPPPFTWPWTKDHNSCFIDSGGWISTVGFLIIELLSANFVDCADCTNFYIFRIARLFDDPSKKRSPRKPSCRSNSGRVGSKKKKMAHDNFIWISSTNILFSDSIKKEKVEGSSKLSQLDARKWFFNIKQKEKFTVSFWILSIHWPTRISIANNFANAKRTRHGREKKNMF